MKVVHAETYENAHREARRLKKEWAVGEVPIVRIVRSPYQGFDVIAVDADLYTELRSIQLIDGLPAAGPAGTESPNELIG